MQTGWMVWGGLLAGLLMAGLLMAAWWFPLWWQVLWRLRWPCAAQASPEGPGGGASAALRTRVWPMWSLGALMFLLPTVLVAAWSLWTPQRLAPFDEPVDAAEAPGLADGQGAQPSRRRQLTQLLQGEQLVPPPPLPPDTFLQPELVAEQPLLVSADRRWERMDAEFVQALLRVFRVMKEAHGYDMALLEGWRSPQRQALLAARGPTVTQAGPWQSYHQWGLAADCAFVRAGRLVISERDPWASQGYALFGQVAERMGLSWGGRWRMADLGHIEWRKPGMQATMRAMPPLAPGVSQAPHPSEAPITP